MMMYAFVAAPAVVVTPFIYVTILSASAIGYFFYGDFPDALSWVGIVILIAVGIYIAVRESRTRKAV